MDGKTTTARTLHLPRALLSALLIGAATFSLVRIWTALAYAQTPLHQLNDLGSSLLMGLRFDLKIWSALALLTLLLASCALLIKRPLARTFSILLPIFLILTNLLAISNHYYYGYYNSPFNNVVFGLAEDDTWIVLLTIWNDFPVIRILIGITLLTWIQIRLWQALQPKPGNHPRSWKYTSACILVILLLGALIRGTLAMQPLNQEDFTVSPNRFLCDLVPNGPMALFVAWRERADYIDIGTDSATGLKQYGFETPMAAAKQLGIDASTPEETLRKLFRQTPKNDFLAQHPPHVAIFLVESWGAEAMLRHTEGNDLHGRLEKHLQSDYWFPNFASGARGTHPSIEALLVNSPVSPLTQGDYGKISYLSAAAKPYKEAGYRTYFLYGASARWRGMGDGMKPQYFDEIVDVGGIRARYPQATASENGVHDEYLFRYAEDLLHEADKTGQKIMLFGMTTTSHAPYNAASLPKNYQARPINMALYPDITVTPEEGRYTLETLQYVSDQLGGFMDRLKASPLGAKTLIAASGDHYLRSFFKLDADRDFHWTDRVPLYLHIPQPYVQGGRFDPKLFGGHRDIFPTLYAHSLSGAQYFGFGEDLLSPTYHGIGLGNFSNVYTPDGVAANLKQPAYLNWEDHAPRLKPVASAPAALSHQVSIERARTALLDWSIRAMALKQITNQPKK